MAGGGVVAVPLACLRWREEGVRKSAYIREYA
jgi:hypothetical protein